MPLAVCATPIGNLADVTLRVLDELARRRHRPLRGHAPHAVLLDRHGIEARLLSLPPAQRGGAHSPSSCRGSRRASGSRSSPTRACPGVNDPGARLVAAALAAGVPVTVLPGPSAVETALVASGLAGEQYRFLGYLPRSEQERAALWQELRGWPHPTVAFESPKRLPRDAREPRSGRCRTGRVAVCRELTKLYEEVVCEHARGARGAVPRRRRAR